jgi:hypothetical protein
MKNLKPIMRFLGSLNSADKNTGGGLQLTEKSELNEFFSPPE